MNSDKKRFGLSSLTLADSRGNCRLHSRLYALITRIFSLLLVGLAYELLTISVTPSGQPATFGSIAEIACIFVATLAVAAFVWSRPKQVIATRNGLAVGSGNKLRVIPWSRVLDVRELPWHRLGPGWTASCWQVDLDRDERFDFCGTRHAREIVKEFIERAERAAH